VWMIRKGCVANIEEGKHSQVFGLHTDVVARLPVPKVNSGAPVVLGSSSCIWDLGFWVPRILDRS